MNQLIFPKIPLSTIKLLDNQYQFRIMYPASCKLLSFIGWYSRQWHLLDDEGLTDALFDRDRLINFFKEMQYCSYASRSYKTLSGNSFKISSCFSTVFIIKTQEQFKVDVCLKIDDVGYLMFEGSYIYLYEESENILHVVYVD